MCKVTTMLKSDFTQNIIALNQLNLLAFRAWSLKPGMGFGDRNKWWGVGKNRPTPHEGLDLKAFRDEKNQEIQLTPTTIVVPLFKGILINIIDDFLGQTVIISHDQVNQEGAVLHGFYAHLSPNPTLRAGSILSETTGLGTIAAEKNQCPAHLHISTAWIAKDFQLKKFSWPDFAKQKGFEPCNPCSFL